MGTGTKDNFELVVIGAGSGGIGAAITAAKLGIKVLLIERSAFIGGNASHSGVSVWEMGVGGTGIPFDIYQRMKCIKDAVGIYTFHRHAVWKDTEGNSQYPPGADLRIDPARCYRDSLLRHGAKSLTESEAFAREHWHGVVFEPEAYTRVASEMLAETGNCTVTTSTSVTKIEKSGDQILRVGLDDGNWVSADYFIDSTDSGFICGMFGVETMLGEDSRSEFAEPSAPENPSNRVNAVTLLYRITPANSPSVEELPDGIPSECWWMPKFPVASIYQYPGGDCFLNIAPSMSGIGYLKRGPETAYEECKRRGLAHWHYLQTHFPEFQKFRFKSFAHSTGVRETHRVRGEYVLTEHDLIAGLSHQEHEDIITIADHAKDTHGVKQSFCIELKQPYGVPYRCLIPKGASNLLIASRAASFSHIAASSCRLSRTMMQLGQAAGTAAKLALESGCAFPSVDPSQLRSELRRQHVELDWPRSREIIEHLDNE